MPDTGVGCTSWRGLPPRPASVVASNALFAACPGLLPKAASNESGLMAPAFWFSALRPGSACDPGSCFCCCCCGCCCCCCCCVAAVGKLLGFFVSCSRGSSWQRCPMLRLTHLVHGRSCFRQHTHTRPRVNVCPICRTNDPGSGIGWGDTYEIARHVLGSRTHG